MEAAVEEPLDTASKKELLDLYSLLKDEGHLANEAEAAHLEVYFLL